jgi:hypothetical protein
LAPVTRATVLAPPENNTIDDNQHAGEACPPPRFLSVPVKIRNNQKPYGGNDFYIFTATDVKTLNGNRLALP